jgi:hypothetical protein
MNKILTLLVLFLFQPLSGFAITVSDYLIDSNIGGYSRSYPGSCPEGSGKLAGADHFTDDHTDYACDIRYYTRAARLGVEVQVTKHSGSDSDKWLKHELDLEFRNYYGMPGYYLKTIDGNAVYVYGAGGREYRWLSGNTVVIIEYRDAQLTKPEPLEIVQAYLAKHPSALSAVSMEEHFSKANKIIWMKDEMDRRLWLCDKWFMQLQLGKARESETLQESVKSMNVFLDYREKYFGIKTADEKNLLAGYLGANNGTGIKAKLTEYKNWWSVHKTDTITMP